MTAELTHRNDRTGTGTAGEHATAGPPVAETLAPAFRTLLNGPPPITIEFWDGSRIDADGPNMLRFNSPRAIRQIVWSPDELGLARAFVTGDLDAVGNVAVILRSLQTSIQRDPRAVARAIPAVIAAGRSIGALGSRPRRPDEERLPRGVRHTLRRDREVISHHYDVGNDFYELVLGPAMTYSCARFASAATNLEDAQSAKHELICRKLGLHEHRDERARLLDVGCGWGSMAIHAATHHDVDVVGITISTEQADFARRRVHDLGLADRVDIRVQDYREIDDGPFDVISSVGMAEHVGIKRMEEYFERLYSLLVPGGRLLNHAIASTGGSRLSRRSFIYRYVFPDGELLDIADTARFMEAAGFEVRDVENLREHYATTLRHWVANLERHWTAAVELVGEARARVWLLYMSGSINGFDDGGIQLMQTLGVRLAADGASGMPRTRADWR